MICKSERTTVHTSNTQPGLSAESTGLDRKYADAHTCDYCYSLRNTSCGWSWYTRRNMLGSEATPRDYCYSFVIPHVGGAGIRRPMYYQEWLLWHPCSKSRFSSPEIWVCLFEPHLSCYMYFKYSILSFLFPQCPPFFFTYLTSSSQDPNIITGSEHTKNMATP